MSYPLEHEPNGILWDASAQALVFASEDGPAVYRWRAPAELTVVGKLPPPGGPPGLGPVVVTRDGTMVTTRFGKGVGGAVVFLRADGSSAAVPALDPARRRIGLAVADDGALFDSYFTFDEKLRVFAGAVARLDLASGERQLFGGLKKPVGILARDGELFVGDQETGTILRAPADGSKPPRAWVTNLDGPDLMCAGPSNSIFAGSRTGTVYRIAADGTISDAARDLRAVRGVAYDPAAHRLFVVERRAQDGSAPATLHVYPVQ